MPRQLEAGAARTDAQQCLAHFPRDLSSAPPHTPWLQQAGGSHSPWGDRCCCPGQRGEAGPQMLPVWVRGPFASQAQRWQGENRALPSGFPGTEKPSAPPLLESHCLGGAPSALVLRVCPVQELRGLWAWAGGSASQWQPSFGQLAVAEGAWWAAAERLTLWSKSSALAGMQVGRPSSRRGIY